MAEERKLIIIGGAEDREQGKKILAEVVRLAGGREARLVVVTVATEEPAETAAEYRKAFGDLGVGTIDILNFENRDEVGNPEFARMLEQATGIFFSGGDQLRITGLIGGTPLDNLMHRRYQEGVLIAGTSSGAAMMPETMIARGPTETAPAKGMVEMSPGLRFIDNVLIDTHFNERGRFQRLITALSQNPRVLGLGIDEDTALVVEGTEGRVIGSGIVKAVDLSDITFSNQAEISADEKIALFDVKTHALPAGYRFDFKHRRPLPPKDHKPTKEETEEPKEQAVGQS